MQISRLYSVDHGVAFPDLLNSEADEGQVQHTKLCLLSSKTNRTVLKWFEVYMSIDIVANVNYLSHCRVLFRLWNVFPVLCVKYLCITSHSLNHRRVLKSFTQLVATCGKISRVVHNLEIFSTKIFIYSEILSILEILYP